MRALLRGSGREPQARNMSTRQGIFCYNCDRDVTNHARDRPAKIEAGVK